VANFAGYSVSKQLAEKVNPKVLNSFQIHAKIEKVNPGPMGLNGILRICWKIWMLELEAELFLLSS